MTTPAASPAGLVTVAICTWNRASQLAAVLADLAADSAAGPNGFEVIVIDNNCTDDTAAVVESAAAKLPVRRVVETRQGLSAARNRAIREAAGDPIIFLDDDVRVPRGWLRAYQDAFADPSVMAAGGRVTALWPDHLPRWVRGHVEPPFCSMVPHHDLGTSPHDVTDLDHVPPTANAAFRREVFRQVGGFREDLGTLVGGEDTDLMGRLLQRFGRIRYLPDANVDHPVERARLSFWWNIGYLHRGGIAQSKFESTGAGTRVLLGVPIWVFKPMVRSFGRAGWRCLRGDLRGAAIAFGRVASLSGFVRGKYASRRQ